MIPLYNLCQLLFLACTWPVLIAFVLLKAKYRRNFLPRFGVGLQQHLAISSGGKTVWIHALSVGEVTSAKPLVTGLRRAFPHISIVFSASTTSGLQIARTLLHDSVDAIIPSPFDLRPVVASFIRSIRPDLFILVETDFWPNLLAALHAKNIPTILVNGRISEKSFSSYRRFAFFFRPLFQSFSHLCMQTAADKKKMQGIGVNPKKMHSPGNLKFDTFLSEDENQTERFSRLIPDGSTVFLAGSTHEGEEDIIFSAWSELKKMHRNLFLIIAPRDPRRGEKIGQLAASYHLSCTYRSENAAKPADLFILDSMGELSALYSLADIAFVGGSMVACGGHNPIEPACLGLPVLFGRHMEDFSEISHDLVDAGGALIITDKALLCTTLADLLASVERRRQIGGRARQCIERQRGVVQRHLEIVRPYL
jgi:3-deoxy-D-manno-octulosonic-acid transferase